MPYFESITNLKRSHFVSVSHAEGVYRWWFTEQDAKCLLVPFGNILDWKKIKTHRFEGQIYYALYVGISNDLHQRIKWHSKQKHSPSAVKSGYLSTLRRTISGLIGKDCSQSEKDVSDILERCYWEWDEMNNSEVWEKNELNQQRYYYPLNIQGNKVLPPSMRTILEQVRSKHNK